MKRFRPTTCISLALGALATFATGCASTPKATDAKASNSLQRPVDKTQTATVSGTWSWTMHARTGSEPRKFTLTLYADGEKLSGKLYSPPLREGSEPRVIGISDGLVKGDEIVFNVIREYGTNMITMTNHYSGKVSGQTIKGTLHSQTSKGMTATRDWEAKREK